MTDDIELPPLPEGMIGMHCTCFDRSDMEDYARAAILADRARRVSAEPVAWTTMPDADDWLFLSGSANPNGKLTGDWRPLYLAPPPTPPADALITDDMVERACIAFSEASGFDETRRGAKVRSMAIEAALRAALAGEKA
jgi:hypothetical protein